MGLVMVAPSLLPPAWQGGRKSARAVAGIADVARPATAPTEAGWGREREPDAAGAIPTRAAGMCWGGFSDKTKALVSSRPPPPVAAQDDPAEREWFLVEDRAAPGPARRCW